MFDLSPDVPIRTRPARVERAITTTRPELARLKSALSVFPNSGTEELDYGEWFKFIAGIHHATDGSDEGLALAHEFSERASEHDRVQFEEITWPKLRTERGGGVVTAEYIYAKARATNNWMDPAVLDDFEVVPVSERTPSGKQGVDLAFVDFASLAHAAVPPRAWVVDQWLPRGTVTLMAGPPGVGKSLVAEQLAIAVANGDEWLGLRTVQGVVLGLFCEDDHDELLRRASRIFEAGFYDPAEASKDLHLDARAGKPNALVTFGNDRIPRSTALMSLLEEKCAAIRPALVILDNIAQLFIGMENDRAQVTAFCNRLAGLAGGHKCAVLLLGHPAKVAGSEFSGSTAWEAAVRTRLFLERREDGTMILRKPKANYAAVDEIAIEWRDPGVFARLAATADVEPQAVERARPIVLAAIRALTARQHSTSHLPTARNYLPKVMASEDLLGGLRPAVIAKTVGAMIDAGDLLVNHPLPWKNASRHAVTGLALRETADA